MQKSEYKVNTKYMITQTEKALIVDMAESLCLVLDVINLTKNVNRALWNDTYSNLIQ